MKKENNADYTGNEGEEEVENEFEVFWGENVDPDIFQAMGNEPGQELVPKFQPPNFRIYWTCKESECSNSGFTSCKHCTF
jgi:hypothetical protein